MSALMTEASEAILHHDDTERRPVTPPNIATATDTSTPYHDWADCASEPGAQDELTQDAGAASLLEVLEICDGADPEVQENPSGDDFVECDDSDTDSLDLDSILPIAEILTSVLRVAPIKGSKVKSFYLDGVPTTEEMTELEAYVKRVESFTLTNATLHGFPFGTILRLSMVRNWQGAFFRSLKILRVVYCDKSTMQALNLFLSPSLESLEATLGDSWDNDCDEALDSFMATLSSEAPNLTCLKIGSIESASWQLFSPITQEYCPFEHLRILHLEDVAIDEWSGLEALGALESLEDLSLTTVLRRPYYVRTPTSADDGEWDVLSDCLPDNDELEFGFGRLKSLRVAARIEFLRDLLGYIESDSLTDLSITLLASSRESQSLKNFRRDMISKKTDPSDEEVIAMIKSGRVRFTFRNEDEFFCLLLDRAAEKWQDLQSIAIDHRQKPGTFYQAHILSAGTVENLLLHPHLRQLEISDWVTDFDVGELIAGHPPTFKSSLQILHLPTNASSYKTTEGIPWTTLGTVNKKLPSLFSFHGYLHRHISDIPDYTAAIPDEILPNCNVETLALGDGPISWDDDIDPHYLLRVGVYLYSLFPHLNAIIAQDDEESRSDWDYIKRLVKMCQASGRGNRVQS